MDDLIRNVSQFGTAEKQAIERLLGRDLREDEQVIIRVLTASNDQSNAATASSDEQGKPALPDWCNVYAGLSDNEVAEIEGSILTRANLTRPSN
jgi:hypothetical protein